MQSGFEKWSVYQAQRIAVLPKGCWSCIHAKSRSQHGETGSVGMLTVLFVNIWVCIVGGNRCLYIYWQVAQSYFVIFLALFMQLSWTENFSIQYTLEICVHGTQNIFQQKQYIYLFKDLFILESKENKTQNNKLCTCVQQMTLKYKDIDIHIS